MTTNLEKLINLDLALCRAMAEEMEDYLKSSVLFWEPNRSRTGGADLPKLTIGGLLLAIRRLSTLRHRLSAAQLQVLDRAREQLDHQRTQWRTRYTSKLARDLRSRLDAWDWYLEDLEDRPGSGAAHYGRQVETRVKAELLLEEEREIGMDAEQSQRRQAMLDRRLRAEFERGDFCWPEPLADGFPPERYWYLWGGPKGD
jgi:hypothetical protein